MVKLKEAFAYPFNNFKRLFIYWLFLIPVFGWFPIAGYILKLYKEVIKGKSKELPAFGEYWKNFKNGFYFCVFLLTLGIAVFILNIILTVLTPLIRIVLSPIINFVISGLSTILIMQYVEYFNFEKSWNLKRGWKIFSKTWTAYFIIVLKVFAVEIAFLIISLIPPLFVITIPAANYSVAYLTANYYREAKKAARVK